MSAPQTKVSGPLGRFLNIKARALAGRARRLATLDRRAVGLRAEDMPYAPLQAHFDSANRRLQQIDQSVKARLAELARTAPADSLDDRLLAIAMVERELDRARRAFGLFSRSSRSAALPSPPRSLRTTRSLATAMPPCGTARASSRRS